MKRDLLHHCVFAAAVTGLAAGSGLLGGCVVEGPPVQSSRPREELRTPKADLPVGSVVLTVSQFPEDTDSDGYADTILATAHLFSHDPRYPLPISPPGAMRFFLLDEVGRTVAEWRFGPDKTALHRHSSGVGVGYIFQLDLERAGAERVEAIDATLRCEFIPESGVAAVQSRGGVTVALGPVR